ncbi:MAG: hypothetical protein COB02_00750 [Candidatus Cloacimonadota bacterium]|nr:MAG: hypothetical protein COB02_00750 [Candidatus Cloacimonadota bacterium]
MELEGLIEEFSQSRYNDLSIEKGSQSIYLRRGATKVVSNNGEKSSSSKKEETVIQKINSSANGIFLKSDRVGIFSSSVKVGEQIKTGDKIGLITAINVSHDLYANDSGKVKSVLVESGVGVAYDMELIELEKKNV